ncbi:MAG: nucleoside-diphosphate kinase [Spirochaetes bacterium RIFOXYC1_FULL_54_7]|nr:MAG: nucleoside-diphosphate kinase [Spirochaetes bacterium RIFOXYC1_FULL_54_7]
MPNELSFAMLKPGIVQRRLVGEILARIEKKGLDIVALKLMEIDKNLARTHYIEHEGKDFYNGLVDYITSGPVVAMVVSGDDAVSLLRKLCGATKVEEALPGTIRGDYADHTRNNVIHASDGVESAKREIGLFFSPSELIAWKDGNDEWI